MTFTQISRSPWTSRILIALAAIVLVLRGMVFTEGGDLAAYASTVLFWLFVLTSIAVVINRDLAVKRHGADSTVLKWILMALCAVAMFVWGLFTDDGIQAVSSTVFFVSLLALLLLLVIQRIRSGGRASSQFPPKLQP